MLSTLCCDQDQGPIDFVACVISEINILIFFPGYTSYYKMCRSTLMLQLDLIDSTVQKAKQPMFLNSLYVRVFTRIVSDNPWCRLLAICSLRRKYNVTFTHCIPNHSRLEWMTINGFFLNDWKLINFKKLFKLTNRRHSYWESAHILHSLRGVNVKVTSVRKQMREITNFFCFPRYQYSWGIVRYMYLRSSNSLLSILAFVLCKKMKQHWVKFHASGQRLIRVKPRGMVQPITHKLLHKKQDGSDHTTWYTKAISVGPRGMVQPITVAMT